MFSRSEITGKTAPTISQDRTQVSRSESEGASEPIPRKKAKGPHQITHGDIARACGYCDSIKYYQSPAERWMKTYEDRAFRWLIGTHGTPLPIPNVCQIRHIVKGRYAKQESAMTKVRKFIRKTFTP